MKLVRVILTVLMLASTVSAFQAEREAENNRLSQIKAKRARGEQITSEERRFAQRVMARRNQASAATRFRDYAKTHPPRDSVGLVPLTDLGKGTHKGESGGLYPGGENIPPQGHLQAGLAIASQIIPLDRDGSKGEHGKIVLLSIGVSNTTMEFRTFQQIAAQDTQLNPQLVLIDGAQGGQAADQAADPQTHYWSVVDQRLQTAGVTPNQVQALWIKETYPGPSQPFPAEAKKLKRYLVDILHTAKGRFPNLKIAYLSSRIYAGYSLVGGNPEPWSYEFGFSVKWLIADQIAAKPELNYDPAKGQVRSPWLAWGPYLWADGVKGRKDGLKWLREDLAADGMHPSAAGRQKVAGLLLDFLKTDPTSQPWFLNNSREQFPDGSNGQVMEFEGAGGTVIAAYLRKPAGAGLFPVVVMLHGGGNSRSATYGLGRSTRSPTADFIAADWAVFSIDFRPNTRAKLDPVEWDDTIAAIRKVRGMPSIDPQRVALLGGSHGANVLARVAARTDASAAVLCAPAALDLAEVAKVIRQGASVNPALRRMIAALEQQHGVPIAKIANNADKYGYSTALTEAANVHFPLLIINGRNDNSSPIPVVEAYMERLRAAGKEVEAYLPENGPHGFYFGRPAIPETQEAARRAVTFIRKHFGTQLYTARQDATGTLAVQSERETESRRFAEIKAKRDRGEQITLEERRFAQSVMARRNQANAATRFRDYAKTHPPRDSVGLAPLIDLETGTYKAEVGGLYPGGENVPPQGHLQAGLAIASQIVPMNRDGRKDESGKIVLLSVGMSNTTQEFQAFHQLSADDDELNPRLLIVDGAQGGQTAAVTAKPEADFWKVVDKRLNAAGVTPKQVQVVWLKQANGGPSQPFPTEAKKLEADLIATLHNLSDRFANLKIVYLSSRIYAGYAVTPLNPEPHAYESAFAVKWVIARQIAGQPELNFDPAKGTVRSAWLAWGPYLWADGVKGRKDGLTYIRSDLGPDGTHPSRSGQEKVARQLLSFLKSDPTSRPWFLAGR
jgi:acetyl esterase/lipase